MYYNEDIDRNTMNPLRKQTQTGCAYFLQAKVENKFF